MTHQWLIVVSWMVFVLIGFFSRIRGPWAQEPLVLIGLGVGGAVFFAIDYLTFNCEFDFSIVLCSAEASIVWGIAAGCLCAIVADYVWSSSE